MSGCDHPVTYNTLCVKCGKVVPNSKTSASLALKGGLLQLSADEAMKVQSSKNTVLQKLQQNKKLALVLDLDHTLLHAVQIDGPTPTQTSQLSGEIHHLPIEEIFGGTVKHLVMKKRPHLDYFLEEVEKLYQITIYTAGTRRYAEAVVKVLDPQRKYIGDRIVSRIDGQPVRPDSIDKSLDKIFLNDSSMAVIVDDREDVWKGPQNEQLLLVRPYVYFYPGSANTQALIGNSENMSEVNNSPGHNGSIMASNQTANSSPAPIVLLHENPGKILKVVAQSSPEYTESDDQLLRCLDILKAIHHQYYDEAANSTKTDESKTVQNGNISSKRSVARTIQEMKRSILSGYTITFSGIIATNDFHPQSNPFWRLAESLGAQVSMELLPRTTHLISFQTNTKKVKLCLQSRAQDVWVLHPDWLIYCRWSLAKAEESTFLLVGIPAGHQFPSPKRDFSLLEEIPSDNAKKANRKRKAVESNFKDTDSTTSNDSLNSSEEKEPKRIRTAGSFQTETDWKENMPSHTLTVASNVSQDYSRAVAVQHDADVEEETSRPNDLSTIDDALTTREDEEGYAEGDGDCRAYWEHKISEGFEDDEEDADSYHVESDDPDQQNPYTMTYSLCSQSDLEDDHVSQNSEKVGQGQFNPSYVEDESEDDFADLEEILINRNRRN